MKRKIYRKLLFFHRYLKQKATEFQLEGRHLLCSMSLDEMSIRELIELKGKHVLTFFMALCIRYKNLEFFRKMKNTNLVMGAKVNSKTNLLNTFHDYFSLVGSVWLQSYEKC